MKLRFKITRSTSLSPPALTGKIVSRLDYGNYRVVNVTAHVVEFNDPPWKLMERTKAMKRLDGGQFEIRVSDTQILIIFNYYVSLTAPIFMFIGLSAFLIYQGEYYGILFFLAFYLVALPIQIIMQRGAANDMLNSILNGLP
jgi:hypothetical protein